VQELTNFQVKVTASTVDAVTWREGQHDDLILAVAITVWMGERCPSVQPFVPHVLSNFPGWRRGLLNDAKPLGAILRLDYRLSCDPASHRVKEIKRSRRVQVA
jgi:hypothetical protein